MDFLFASYQSEDSVFPEEEIFFRVLTLFQTLIRDICESMREDSMPDRERDFLICESKKRVRPL